MFPVLAETDVKISQNEKSSQPFTVFIDGLNFLNSYWQFFGVNVWMVKCDAASLTLEYTNIRNVTIDNCTFGNWTFRQVDHIIIKNSRSSISKDLQTLLNFYNSSGLIENITVANLNFKKIPNGLIIQNNSYIQITKTNFVNNTVGYGLIKVIKSSKLEMSNCTIHRNKAINYAGAIFAHGSFIYLTNTNFNDNNAIQGGGALFVKEGSFVFLKSCTFSNNQVKVGYSAKKKLDGYGGAILLTKSTIKGINVNFTGNKANYGGGLFLTWHSIVKTQHMDFSHNIAVFGSAIYGTISCKFSCKNCSLYENRNAAVNNIIFRAAVNIYNHSTINVLSFKCENNTGYNWGCIFATYNSSVFIYDGTFSRNIGSAISLRHNSHLLAVNSSFINNETPGPGGAIHSENSTLDISHSICYQNKANKTGSFYLAFSSAALTYCTFSNNLNKAVVLSLNTMASIANCSFEGNLSPHGAGALLVDNFGDVTVSQTTFQENSGGDGGAVAVLSRSSLVISNCSFSRNVASAIAKEKVANGGGGAIYILMSVLEIFQSQFDSNFAIHSGGAVFFDESSLLIHDSVFQNNIAIFSGGTILIANQSSLIIQDSSLINNSIHYDTLYGGGGLSSFSNSTSKITSVHLFGNKGAIMVEEMGQVTIFDSSFVNNTGPAISIKGSGSLQMDHCTVLNNSGVPVFVSSSSINVTNVKFSHNTKGVLLIQESSEAFFCNCSFNDNSALKGGALIVVNSGVKLIACNFTGNSATNGGVFFIRGNLFLKNCIVINNTAHGDGGVGYLVEHSRINITTSIFRKNSAPGLGGVFWIRNSTAIVSNSSFVNNSAGTNGGVIYTE